MPYSESRMTTGSGAVVPIVWYLLNLLILPIISFIVLLTQFFRAGDMPEIRRAHTRAATFMSVIGAVLIGSGVLAAWLLSGNSGGFWTFALVWAIVLHTSFVLWGIISMAQAMSDRMPYFPRRWL